MRGNALTQQLSAALNIDSAGTVSLYAEYEIPSNLRSLTLAFPDYLSPEETAGFSHTDRHRCEWDEATQNPWIQFRYGVNRTSVGGYEFVDTGGWAILKYPPINLSWRHVGESVELSRTYGVRGTGITSSDGSLVYLGPHREERFRAGGQRFRLAIPDRASLTPSLADVQASLSHASTALDVGGRNDEVIVVAAPASVDWGWGGLQSGVNGFWALASSRVNRPANTWVHEYIHTRQEWERHNSTDWLVEGTTKYYAALLTFLEGRISFDDFRDYLATDRHGDSVLVDPEQWTSPNAYYTKGRRVMAALDAEIRRVTGGDRTFQDAFRRINDLDGDFTHDDLRGVLERVTGHDFDPWLSKYVERARSPPVPDDEARFVGDAPSPGTGPISDDDDVDDDGPVTTTTCSVCGATVDADDRFCSECGTAQFRECPICGRTVTSDYCPECGTSMVDTCDVCGARRHPSERYCSRCGTEF
jgi:predicted nucleic acid-binding Zn ribbon protein